MKGMGGMRFSGVSGSLGIIMVPCPRNRRYALAHMATTAHIPKHVVVVAKWCSCGPRMSLIRRDYQLTLARKIGSLLGDADKLRNGLRVRDDAVGVDATSSVRIRSIGLRFHGDPPRSVHRRAPHGCDRDGFGRDETMAC
jgi:hypothetical protein